MLESRARVIERRGEAALIEVLEQAGCGVCVTGKACGTTQLARWLSWRPRQLEVANPIQAGPGDEVIVAVEDGKLARSAAAVFARALGLVLVGAVVGFLAGGGGDALAAAGAAAGLAGAYVLIRRSGRTQVHAHQAPRIVRAVRATNL
ncbi:SoxR reducing system RseC family protein [Pelomicrobium sp. G1]|uniref:SoxR reducing system RseC family protein n=1 Tax=unclassified Pelomicrobium TaxID=2815318 RepID=UPI003F7648A7